MSFVLGGLVVSLNNLGLWQELVLTVTCWYSLLGSNSGPVSAANHKHAHLEKHDSSEPCSEQDTKHNPPHRPQVTEECQMFFPHTVESDSLARSNAAFPAASRASSSSPYVARCLLCSSA